MDRISDLPDGVIERILENLPLIYQVRTSVLSSSWRNHWAKLPSLEINANLYDILSTSKSIPNKPSSDTKSLLPGYYLNVINSLLTQHIGHLREFSLYIPSAIDQVMMREFHLPLQFVLKNGIETLSLAKYDSEPYVLPVFPAVCLKNLTLVGRGLRFPPSFNSFPNLVSLCQNCVDLQADTISNFISSCHVLEVLKLDQLWCPRQVLNIPSSPLHTLSLRGVFKSVSLGSAQTVQKLELWFDRPYGLDDISTIDFNFFHNMTNLEHLTLGGLSSKILGCCTFLLRLGQLKKLSLYNVSLECTVELKCLLNLSTSSPNMKELLIAAFDQPVENTECQSMLKIHRNHTFDNLRKVYISVLYVSQTLINLIELLLICSPLLELMSIEVIFYKNGTAMLTIQEHVTDFCRKYPRVKFKLSNCGILP